MPTHMRMHANACTHTCAIPARTQETTYTLTHFSILVEVRNKSFMLAQAFWLWNWATVMENGMQL